MAAAIRTIGAIEELVAESTMVGAIRSLPPGVATVIAKQLRQCFGCDPWPVRKILCPGVAWGCEKDEGNDSEQCLHQDRVTRFVRQCEGARHDGAEVGRSHAGFLRLNCLNPSALATRISAFRNLSGTDAFRLLPPGPRCFLAQARKSTRSGVISAAGISTTARDLARFYFMLRGSGCFGGIQIMSARTVEEARIPSGDGKFDGTANLIFVGQTDSSSEDRGLIQRASVLVVD
jgi:hypothetical protein